ncbi:MAG: hypothetical protein ABIQ02_09795 [Saprospiraceae bacterium]
MVPELVEGQWRKLLHTIALLPPSAEEKGEGVGGEDFFSSLRQAQGSKREYSFSSLRQDPGPKFQREIILIAIAELQTRHTSTYFAEPCATVTSWELLVYLWNSWN